MRHGRRTRTPILHMVAHPNALPHARVGYAVSRRVGNAVVRNQVKRRLRAIVSELPLAPGFDIVVIPQHPSASTSFQGIRTALMNCVDRLQLSSAENERSG
jgi:ribonuclease P protein component